MTGTMKKKKPSQLQLILELNLLPPLNPLLNPLLNLLLNPLSSLPAHKNRSLLLLTTWLRNLAV